MAIQYQLEYRDGFNIWHRHVMPYMPQHMHRNIEIIWLKKGHTRCTVDLIEYELNAGDLLVVFSEQLHSYIDMMGDLENYALIFLPDIPIYDSVFANMLPTCPVVHIGEDDELERIFKEAFQTTFKKNIQFIEGAKQGYTSILLSKILPRVPMQEKKLITQNVEYRLIRYCADNYNKPITLKNLADEFGYSPTYFSRIFNEKFKIGFTDFINSLRIQEAKQLLKQDKSMTEIAFACGFTSIRNFNRVFKEHAEKTPSEYKKHKTTGDK
ncbi:MAG: AraC family transcriptional regulator [Clostridia bacterium]|nr:AraC family transcriptional regulator [Clostridia bacterium]